MCIRFKKKHIVYLFKIKTIDENGIDDEIIYSFKEESVREKVFEEVLYETCKEHYKAWCKCHKMEENDDSWYLYNEETEPGQGRFWFSKGKVDENSPLWKNAYEIGGELVSFKIEDGDDEDSGAATDATDEQ